MTAKKDIRALSKEQLRDFFKAKGDKAFRGNQVYEWLWGKSAHSFDAMTNLSKETRSMLEDHFVINHIEVDSIQRSNDGTIKNAVKLHDGLIVESVLIPKVMGSGLKYYAHVVSANTFSEMSAKELNMNIGGQLEMATFKTVQEAKDWLKSKQS